MIQGKSIIFEGQELVEVPNYNNSCQMLPLNCMFYQGDFTCARSNEGFLPCRAAPVIFITKEQYLELRLVGDT